MIGVPTGISRNLSLVSLDSPAKPRIFIGTPQVILNREVIQGSESIRKAVEKIFSTLVTMGQNLVLVSKNDAAIVETSPQRKAIRGFQNGYITVTNHFQVKEMEEEQVPDIGPRKTSIPDGLFDEFFTRNGSKRRAEKMKMALSQSQCIDIDPKRAMEILDQVAGPGTVQSVVAIPKKEEFWVAKMSQPPVTKGEWIKFNIDELLV